MKNVKVRLKKQEVDEGKKFLLSTFNTFDPMSIEDYVHRMNIQSLAMKFYNKSKATRHHKPNKIISLTVNVNEVISSEYVLNRMPQLDPYNWAIFNDVLVFVKKMIEHELTIEDNVILQFR